MISPFLELGLIVIVATVLGLVFRMLKQPIILAYIATGIVLGASFFNVIGYYETIKLFSEIGIAFLLYLIGLNMNIGALKEVGKISLLAGIGQITLASIAGFFLVNSLGFSLVESIYIAVALSFSSTIIVIKLLTDKNEMHSLHGRISVGVLLVQDFFAIIALLFVASIGPQFSIASTFSSFLFRATSFLAITIIIAKLVMPKLFDLLAQSQELLFLSGVSWAFFLAGISFFLGFSIEIGAFVAGVTLAHLPYSFEISGKIRYLRDFFLVLFFVALGSQLVFSSPHIIVFPAIVLSMFILVVNPIIVAVLTSKLGYKSRTSFLTAISMTQLSEFSLILVALGEKFGHIGPNITSLITLVGVITISISTYLILNAGKLYQLLLKHTVFLQKRKHPMEETEKNFDRNFETVFLGFDKLGHSIFTAMNIPKEKTLIVEFDPQLEKELGKEAFNCVFGDAAEPGILELIRNSNPKTIISTIRDDEVSTALLKQLSLWENKPGVVLTAENTRNAIKLYEMQASYVIIPTLLVGKEISETIGKIQKGKINIEQERQKQITELQSMLERKMK